jgi:alkanesulfonate monooxygenase SsuD/methylene tetrahydromethanopterin reductase-like flavin-dependent oxidoreductase (luciferase family)
MFYGAVADDGETAWNRMRAGYAYFDDMHANFRSSSPDKWFKVDDPNDLDSGTISPERDEELRSQAVFGSPAEMIEQIESLRDRLGDDLHFIFRARHPGMDHAHSLESVRRFGEEVIPHFD